MKKIFVLFVILLSASKTYSEQIEIMKYFNLGEYNVGFRYEKIIDTSRTYDENFRPIQLFIWFPTEEDATEPIKYTDYIYLNDLESEPWNANEDRKNKLLKDLLQEKYIELETQEEKDDIILKYQELLTAAYNDTSIIDQELPLLVFAPGGNTPGYLHSVMCEYLASHGYIVASFPSRSTSDSLRWPFDQTGLKLQIDDMKMSIKHLSSTIKEIDSEKIGLISWSVGGVSQALLSAENDNIDVLISIDSGLGREYGVEMLKSSPDFDFNNISIPYIHFTGQQKEMYDVPRSTDFIDSINSLNKHSEVIEAFAHQHFASSIGFIPEIVSNDGQDSDITRAYVNLSDITLEFLNKFIKK